jgi:hypothetical protein
MPEHYGGQTEAEGGELRICVYCRHCFVTSAGYMCRRPDKTKTISVVTGEIEHRSCLGERLRMEEGMCGYDGDFWEGKG